MSQLLSKLQSRLRSATTVDQRAEIVAKTAAVLARLGRFGEARQSIEDLRKTYGDGRSGVVTVWIMVAEALVHHYEDFRPEAADRMARAQVLSIAMKYDPVIALASAWRASFHFEYGVYDEMVNSLELAAKHSGEESHDANFRLSMVLFNSFTISGNNTAAQYWFMRAHRAVEKADDPTGAEALLYNRAAFRITQARAENCIRAIDIDELRGIRLETMSALNYQKMSNLATLPEHLRLWDARLRMLEGDFQTAVDTLKVTREEPRFAVHNFSRHYIDLEIAFCEFNIGHFDEALSVYQSVCDETFSEFDVDEQMVAAWMRHRLETSDSRFTVAGDSLSHLNASIEKYQETMGSLAKKLQPFIR